MVAKLKIILISIYVSLAVNTKAQDVVFDWAYGLSKTGGYGSQTVEKVICDSLGNIYAFGVFGGTVQFDYNNQTQQAASNGGIDCFIMKLSPSKDFMWVKTFGGVGPDKISDVSIYDNNSLYVVGSFHDTVVFNSGPNPLSISAAGQYQNEIFVMKLDTAGNFIWAKDFGSPYSYNGTASITVDGNENIYVGGGFQDTVDFDPGLGVFELISEGDQDAFVQKLNSNGDFIWAKRFGSPAFDFITGISTDANGNIYSIGHYEQTVDFDPGNGVIQLTSNGYRDAFIQKLDKNGDFVFAKTFGGTGSMDRINGIFIKDQYIYTTGMFSGTVDFDTSPNINNLSSSGLGDIYIHKIDTTGNFQWVRTIGGNAWDEGIAISVDENHNVYTTGLFSNTIDFDPANSTFMIQSNSTKEQFILKLNSLGGFEWVYALVNNGTDTPKHIAVNNQDELIICGTNKDNTDFENGSGNTYLSGGNAFEANGFIFKLKQCYVTNSIETVQACKKYKWINGLTYYNSTSSPVYSLNTVDGCDSIVVLNLTILNESTGTETITTCDDYTWTNGITYTSSNNTAKDTLINSAGCDSVVTLNLVINNSYNSTQSITTCDSYTWIDGNTYNSSNNSSTHLLNTIHGCDSIITLDLTINSVSDATITLDGDKIIANNSGVNYQWLDCDNNMLPIWGAIEDTFIIPSLGSYAVAIAELGCVDTSDCITVTHLKTNEISAANKFSYYPNPTNGKVNITTSNSSELSVFDITGREIKLPKNINKKFLVDLSEYQSGVYIFLLKFIDESINFRVILK